MGSYFTIVQGTNNVIISVPHGKQHQRENRRKKAETNTIELGKLIQEKTNSHLIYLHDPIQKDPNFDEHSEYRKALIQYIVEHKIKFLIDIHGAREDSIDFEIGTNNLHNIGMDATFLEFVKSSIHSRYEYSIDNRFKASHEFNISNQIASSTHIYALQFEISNRIRLDEAEFHNMLEQMVFLIERVKDYDKHTQ